jgi:hypothetical protein
MSPERWRHLRELLDRALQVEGAERSAFLDRNCSGDPSLRQELDRLLAAEWQLPSSFLESTAVALGPMAVATAGDSVFAAGTKLGPYALETLLGAHAGSSSPGSRG